MYSLELLRDHPDDGLGSGHLDGSVPGDLAGDGIVALRQQTHIKKSDMTKQMMLIYDLNGHGGINIFKK